MWLISAATTALLVAVSGRYGYHRDELYFLAAGRHLAWGYADQPPLAPLVARVMSTIAPGSLVVLRLPAAVAAGGVVVLTGLIARELRAGEAGQLLAAAAVAVAAVFLGAGHLMGTTVFDLLAWAALLLLVLRVLRTGSARLWPVIGLVAGVGLLDNTLVAFLLAAIAVGMLAVGPRAPLRSPWLLLGVAIGGALWLPYLFWQARHGWPQLAESRAIAAGHSGSSQPRWQVLPFQVLLVGPTLAPVWMAGLVRILRNPALRWCRSLGVAYLVLAVAFVATGGKAYYLAGMFPLLVAAGAEPTLAWMRRSSLRRALVVAAFVAMLPGWLVALPVLPQASLAEAKVVALNYDLGEQVAWPAYVDQIAAAYRTAAPARPTAIVTSNYGEAGAVDRYGRRSGLPHAYSGQTGYWWWGRPPETATAVLAVGFSQQFLRQSFTGVRLLSRLDNKFGLDNDEQHAPLWLCSGRRASWRTLWPRFKST